MKLGRSKEASCRVSKTCSPTPFWPVSGKDRRPFCPDDKWGGLTGHFSLSLSLHSSSPSPPLLLPPPLPFSTTPLESHNLFPRAGCETDLWRWQIYRCLHEVKRLSPLITPPGPLLGEIEPPFISSGVPVKGSAPIYLLQQGLASQKWTGKSNPLSPPKHEGERDRGTEKDR